MAIVHPASDASRAMLMARAPTATMFPPTISPDFEMGLDTAFVKSPPERITEPLTELDSPLEEVSDPLLADSSEEGSDLQDDLPGRPRRSTAATARQASGAEDAFQSYLRDIR